VNDTRESNSLSDTPACNDFHRALKLFYLPRTHSRARIPSFTPVARENAAEKLA